MLLTIIFCLITLLAAPGFVVARSPQTLNLLHNQLSYATWPSQTVAPTDYYFHFLRHGQTYTNNFYPYRLVEEKDITVMYARVGYPALYFGIQNYSDFENIATYTIPASDLNFAYLYLQFGQYTENQFVGNKPTLLVSVCGEKYSTVIEEVEQTPFFNLHEPQNETPFLIANPGTCHDDPVLRITKPKRIPAEAMNEIEIRFLSFRHYVHTNYEQMTFHRVDGGEMTMINTNYFELARSDQLLIDTADWDNGNYVGFVGSDSGQIESHFRLGSDPYDHSFTLSSGAEINAITVEADHSLSILTQYDPSTQVARHKSMEFLVATEAAYFARDVSMLTPLTDDVQANYHAIPYLSQNNGWHVGHLPAAAELDWLYGFYIGARIINSVGVPSPIRNIYFCQFDHCQPEVWPELPLQLARVSFDQDDQGEFGAIYLSATAPLDLDGYLLAIGQEEGITLSGILDADSDIPYTQIITSRDLSRDGGAIRLYSTAGELIDELIYDSVPAPLSLQKLQQADWVKRFIRN
jgi:hypothetical protein